MSRTRLRRRDFLKTMAAAAVVGTDSVDVVRKNAALLRDFKPLSPEEMRRLTVKLEPFLAGASLPWMRPGYRDGEGC